MKNFLWINFTEWKVNKNFIYSYALLLYNLVVKVFPLSLKTYSYAFYFFFFFLIKISLIKINFPNLISGQRRILCFDHLLILNSYFRIQNSDLLRIPHSDFFRIQHSDLFRILHSDLFRTLKFVPAWALLFVSKLSPMLTLSNVASEIRLLGKWSRKLPPNLRRSEKELKIFT